MAFRHVVLLTLAEDAPQGRAEEIVAALRALPAEIPGLLRYEVGLDLGLDAGNATVAIVCDTDDEAGWQAYRDHPAHRAVIDEFITGAVASRAAVQHVV